MARRKRKKNRIPRDIAEIVSERAQGMCEIMSPATGCNGQAEHMHHRKLRSQGGEHTVENLVHVCSICHHYVHMHPAISYTNGWLVRGWREPIGEPFLRRGGTVLLLEDGEMEGVDNG